MKLARRKFEAKLHIIYNSNIANLSHNYTLNVNVGLITSSKIKEIIMKPNKWFTDKNISSNT